MSCGCAERRVAIVSAVKRVGAFIKRSIPVAKYRVAKSIQHDGKWYEPGDDFEIDERDSAALVAAGAIEEAAEPKAEAKKA